MVPAATQFSQLTTGFGVEDGPRGVPEGFCGPGGAGFGPPWQDFVHHIGYALVTSHGFPVVCRFLSP